MVQLVEKYLEKLGLEGAAVISFMDASLLLNQHTISYYRNRLTLREEKEYTARELAEKLADIEVNFRKAFEEACENDIGEE